MTKASKDSSKKLPSAKNKSVSDKTVPVGNPTKTEKLSTVERFAERMRLKGITPPADIVTNGQVQIFYSDGKVCGSVLNTDNSTIGFFGYLDSDDAPFKWAIKPKDEHQISIAATIEIELQKRFNGAKSTFAKTTFDKDTSEDVDLVVNQSDAEPSIEQTEENYETSVLRLSALSDRDYDLVRKSEAKRLGVRVSTLDKAVANEQNNVNALKIMGPRLLFDVYEIVTSLDVQQIGTAKIISELCAGNNKIWSVFNRGDQIDPKTIAHILNLYGVTPRDIRFSDVVLKGYTRESIVAAHSRYFSSTAQTQHDDSTSE